MSTAAWWVLGYVAAGVLVVVAAALLITIIVLGRRILRQAQEITAALDGARENTNPMFDIAAVNHDLDRITRGLRAARTGA